MTELSPEQLRRNLHRLRISEIGSQYDPEAAAIAEESAHKGAEYDPSPIALDLYRWENEGLVGYEYSGRGHRTYLVLYTSREEEIFKRALDLGMEIGRRQAQTKKEKQA